MGGRGTAAVRNSGPYNLSTRTREQLDTLYESAAASKDRDLMKEILTEWRRRDEGKPESVGVDNLLGAISSAKKRGAFKKQRKFRR